MPSVLLAIFLGCYFDTGKKETPVGRLSSMESRNGTMKHIKMGCGIRKRYWISCKQIIA